MRNFKNVFGAGVAIAAITSACLQGCGSSGKGSTFGPRDGDGSGEFDPGEFLTFEGGVDGLLGAGCAGAKAEATRLPVYMHIVLDGSGSMEAENKWTAVVAALDAIFDDFHAQGSAWFGVGLTIFADLNDKTIGEFTAGPYDKMDVPIGFVDQAQHARLRARVDRTAPNLGTPTFEVLSGQYPLVERFTATAPLLSDGKKILVFVSDGVPDPDMPAGINEGPFSLTLAQAMSAKNPSLQTFAVGIGPIGLNSTELAYDPRFMGALAVAGGTAKAGCDPMDDRNEQRMCHFQITPGGKPVGQIKQEFIDAVDQIRTRSLTCEFKLDRSNAGIDPARVNVVFTDGNGQKGIVPPGAQNGWTYDDPTNPLRVFLHGAICEKAKADPRGKIEIVIGCRTILK